MKKRRAPATVLLERKVAELYSSLKEGDPLKKAIDRGLEAAKDDMFAGERIRKRHRFPDITLTNMVLTIFIG